MSNGAMLYTQGLGSKPENVEIPQIDTRNPTELDINYPIGKRWINSKQNAVFSLTSFSFDRLKKIANWSSLTGLNISAVGIATMVAGTVTINNASCLSTSKIFITAKNLSGGVGFPSVNPSTVTNGNFILTSSSLGDTSSYYYFIVN